MYEYSCTLCAPKTLPRRNQVCHITRGVKCQTCGVRYCLNDQRNAPRTHPPTNSERFIDALLGAKRAIKYNLRASEKPFSRALLSCGDSIRDIGAAILRCYSAADCTLNIWNNMCVAHQLVHVSIAFPCSPWPDCARPEPTSRKLRPLSCRAIHWATSTSCKEWHSAAMVR